MRYLPFIIELALTIYALIDCVQAGPSVRNLPQWAWIMLIIFVPIVGAVAYLIAGKPQATAPRNVPWPSTRTAGYPEHERPPRGPDDDPEFLAGIQQSDAQHEQMLKDWEEQLREREKKQREADSEED